MPRCAAPPRATGAKEPLKPLEPLGPLVPLTTATTFWPPLELEPLAGARTTNYSHHFFGHFGHWSHWSHWSHWCLSTTGASSGWSKPGHWSHWSHYYWGHWEKISLMNNTYLPSITACLPPQPPLAARVWSRNDEPLTTVNKILLE